MNDRTVLGPQGPPRAAPGPAVARVLVADDQEDGRRALSRGLKALGYDVEVAADGIEALAKLPLGADLVLLDAQMPGLDGFEVARRIRAVADVFDALTNNRHYRDALPNSTVWEMMQAERGRHFDPAVLDLFVESREAVEAIQRQSVGG